MHDPFSPDRPGKPRSGANTVERRKSERFAFSAVAEVTEPSSKAGIAVRISDVGLHGCYADSLTVFPVGTLIKLSIRHSGLHFATDAKVVYAKTGMGMGLNFVNLSAEMQSILQTWLPGNKGASAPAVERDSPPEVLEPAQPATRKEKVTLARLIELMMYKGQLTELEGRELLKELQQSR